jgi:MFS transporter, FSR family, fosmidomycin resistance protein
MVVDTYQGALPAILPFLKENLGLSYTVTGMILIVANITSSVVQPLFGFLSDKKEKAFLLPMGAFLAGAGFSLLPATQSYLVILLLVAVSGMGIASYHPEGFKTARFFTGERMATGMSVFSVGGNAGMALGPILALSLVNYFGFSSLPWMVLPALAFTVAIIILRKTVAIPKAEASATSTAKLEQPRGAHRALFIIICVIIMRTWTQMGLMTYIPFYMINFLKGDPVVAGKLVSMLLVGGVFGTLAGAPLADRWGHRFWLRLSMLGSAILFPFIFYFQGFMLLATVTLLGMILISTFSVTVVMGQNLLPGNLGVASGLIVGFAIGAGGIGVTLLGVIADHFGVPFALKCIGALPVAGFLISLMLKYPARPVRSNPEPGSQDLRDASGFKGQTKP